MTNYETRLLLDCALRIVRSFPHHGTVASHLSDWVERAPLGVEWDPEVETFRTAKHSRVQWKALEQALSGKASDLRRAKPDTLAQNCRDLAEYLRLSSAETAIFTLSARARRGGPLDALVDALVDEARLPVDRALACMTGLTISAVRKAMHPTGKLLTAGLISREKARHNCFGLAPSDRLGQALEPPARGLDDILQGLFAHPEKPTTEWRDFDHLGEARDFALRLVKGALRSRARGVNLLFYGPPGTGKTELCKAVAARLGVQLFAVGEADDDGDEPSRSERQQHLRLGQHLLAGRRDALVLFDEMEDLLAAPFGLFLNRPQRGASKVHVHRLLENNPVPTLWTTNSIADCDPAMLRRMTYTLEIRRPPQYVRERVWERLSIQYDMPVCPETRHQLARDVQDPPALAANALRAAKIAGGGEADLQLAVRASAKAVRGGREPAPSAPSETRFDPELVNADTKLVSILERLTGPDAPRAVSLCLSGPPGTGKSAFARHLAEKMGMPVVQKRASDLIGPFVGQTEAQIAAAFAEARQEGAFLIFDEADSFLATRDMAHRNWEVTKVNEMLTWMESHPLPFACTTNMPDYLDAAALRRFTFRATFLPLTQVQRCHAFRQFFHQDPPRGLAALDLLTPGDFAVVAKRTRVMGISQTAEVLLELEREQQGKSGVRAAIGFRHG